MEIGGSEHLSNDVFARRVAFIGTVGLLILLPILNPETYLEIYAFVPDGILVTFRVAVGSIFISIVIGMITGVLRAWNKVLNRIISVYVEVVRGIPLLVQLIYIYFVLGKPLRIIGLGREGIAMLAISICYGAYMAEIVRAGLLSVSKGQIEAAVSLGMSKIQVYMNVIVPQAIKVITPPFGNEFIALLKDSSLVSIIAVTDLMRRAREYASVSFNYFEAFSVAALLYLLMTLFFSSLVAWVEKYTSLEAKRKRHAKMMDSQKKKR